MSESIFLAEQDVKVTNTRFIVPSETYAMSGIISIKTNVIPAKSETILGKKGRSSMSWLSRLKAIVLSLLLFGGCSKVSFAIGKFWILVGLVSSCLMCAGIWYALTDSGVPDGPSTRRILEPAVYTITLRTSSGEVKALETRDANFANRVSNALNNAIIARG
jgi:Family of unknown function (DUF6232)